MSWSPDSVPDNWQQSLDEFRKRGLTNAEIQGALREAQRKDPPPVSRWRYAMGILWNLVDDRSHISR